jgi:hypothetical protein
MDWGSIANGAIYGAIGGGAGALLGGLLAAPIRNTNFGSQVSTVLTVIGAIVGYYVAEPLLDPYIGDYLPSSKSDSELDAQFDAILIELNEVPIFAAILEREPELGDKLKHELQVVVEKSSTPAAANMLAFSASYSLIQSRYIYYIARATDEDLLILLKTNTEITSDLFQRDPQFCYDLNYNPLALSAFRSIDEIRNKVGPEIFDRQQAEGAELVRNAHDKIPDYDVAIATSELEKASAVMVAVLGQEKLGLVTGQIMAGTKEDAALACEATLALFNSILGQEHPVTLGRHIFAVLS